MSILEKEVIDAVGVSEDGKVLSLMLADHLDWSNEYEHLMLLQDKINTYIAYLENRQFEESYPNHDCSYAVISIYFVHDIPKNCEKFLQAVQDQIGSLGIKIEATITG